MDFINCIIIFILSILIRFFSVGIFYKGLKHSGYGLNLKEYMVLSYGGLRGSHSLILALVVAKDKEKYDARFTELIILFLAAIVFLSLTF